ncbi:MAG: hypothetical protein ACC645_22710 [Pirellulales bacterium]
MQNVETELIEWSNRSRVSQVEPWPAWYRGLLIALATCILCSCRGVSTQPLDVPGNVAPDLTTTTLPPSSFAGGSFDDASSCSADSVVVAGDAPGTWRPPGLASPWPTDEYLCDGGDRGLPTSIRSDWSVHGLDLEDTIVHYDTLDGRIVVEPTNRVCIYAPRFGAVRRVENPLIDAGRDQVLAVQQPVEPHRGTDILVASTALQRNEPVGETRIRTGSTYRLRQQGGGLENQIRLAEMDDALRPFEDLKIFRLGLYDQQEKARLAQAVAAAIVWTGDQAVQVILDGKKAAVATRDQQVEVLYGVDEPDHPSLRVVKIASTATARPGETVDFTIRYDNVGDQTIGNVTLLDNLTPRLEFVPDSAKSTAAADFSTEPNEAGSLVLRWDFKDPLEPGKGGVVRFRCKVR